jgi:hypothetical protein
MSANSSAYFYPVKTVNPVVGVEGEGEIDKREQPHSITQYGGHVST